MVANGYTLTAISRMLWPCAHGFDIGDIRVRIETATRAKALADQCAIIPGPSDQARAMAARNGWLREWLWEDLGNGKDTHPNI
jgi:hypothetical protein